MDGIDHKCVGCRVTKELGLIWDVRRSEELVKRSCQEAKGERCGSQCPWNTMGSFGNEATPRGALWEPRERCESVVGAWEQGNVRGAGMGAVGTKTIGNETKDE